MSPERNSITSHTPVHSRRAFLGMLGATLAYGAMNGCSSQSPRQAETKPITAAQPIKNVEAPLSHAETGIQEKIKTLGISPDKDEVSLWKTYGFAPLTTRISSPEKAEEETNKRLARCLYLMEQSKNPYFKRTIQLIHESAKDKDLLIDIVPADDNQTPGVSRPLSTFPIEHPSISNKFSVAIQAVTSEILYKLTAEEIAILLVHEVKHAENILLRQKNSDPNKSLKDKLDAEYQLTKNPLFLPHEEADAYANHSEAYIYHRALGGQALSLFSIDAGQYVAGGMTRNEAWTNFIATRYKLR